MWRPAFSGALSFVGFRHAVSWASLSRYSHVPAPCACHSHVRYTDMIHYSSQFRSVLDVPQDSQRMPMPLFTAFERFTGKVAVPLRALTRTGRPRRGDP